jgi:hypothetical protein
MKCANRLCDSEALYFRSGSLHAIDCIAAEERIEDEPVLRQRVIWLCEKCSRLFTSILGGYQVNNCKRADNKRGKFPIDLKGSTPQLPEPFRGTHRHRMCDGRGAWRACLAATRSF